MIESRVRVFPLQAEVTHYKQSDLLGFSFSEWMNLSEHMNDIMWILLPAGL